MKLFMAESKLIIKEDSESRSHNFYKVQIAGSIKKR